MCAYYEFIKVIPLPKQDLNFGIKASWCTNYIIFQSLDRSFGLILRKGVIYVHIGYCYISSEQCAQIYYYVPVSTFCYFYLTLLLYFVIA